MSEFSKRNKTKKVVFNKDYKAYRKGETHYIHEEVVKQKKLKNYGIVSDVDFKAEYRKAAKIEKEQQKEGND